MSLPGINTSLQFQALAFVVDALVELWLPCFWHGNKGGEIAQMRTIYIGGRGRRCIPDGDSNKRWHFSADEKKDLEFQGLF